jgi:hypothetical protein
MNFILYLPPSLFIGSREYDGHGLTPLHWALVSPQGRSQSVEVVEILITTSPDVVLFTEEIFGALPLHLACMSRETPVAIILSLCHKFPQGFSSLLHHEISSQVC